MHVSILVLAALTALAVADGCHDRALPSRLVGGSAAKVAAAAAAAVPAVLWSSLESVLRAARRCQRSARGLGVDTLC